MAETREPRVRWGWLVFALVLGVVVLFVTGFGGGACAAGASAAAGEICTTEPFIGPVGVWVAWIAYVLLAAYAVFQAFRRP